jgi:hypothetical protein
MPQFQATQVSPAQNFMGQQLQQLGQGVEQAGAGVMRLADRINDSKARSADTEFSEFTRAALSQYRNMRGKDAVQSRDKFLQDLEQKRKELAGGLDNQWQRELFSERATFRSSQFTTYVDDHYQGQATAYELGEASAALKANFKDFAQQYTAAGTIPQGAVSDNPIYKDTMRQVQVLARAQGIPEDSEQFRLMRESAEDNLHVTAMLSMVENQDPQSRQMAREYWKQNGQRVSPDNRAKVEQQLRTMDVDDDAFMLSRELRGYSEGLGNQMELLDQLRAFGGIDGVTYNATAQKLQAAYGLDKAAKDDTRNRLRDEYERSLAGAIQSGEDWTSWLSSNPLLVDSLNTENMLRDAQEFHAAKGRIDTQDGLDWLSGIEANPQQIVGVQWSALRAQAGKTLSNGSLDRLENLYVKANNLQVGPSGRKRVDLVKLTSDEKFNQSLVEKVFGEAYNPKWFSVEANDEQRAAGQRWLNTQIELEAKMNAAGVSGDDRDAQRKWVTDYAASAKAKVTFAPSLGEQQIDPIQLQISWPNMSDADKQRITFQESDGQGNTVRVTLGDWYNKPELRTQAKQDVADAIAALKTQNDPELLAKATMLEEVLQRAQSSDGSWNDITKPPEGLDPLIRTYLQAEIARGDQTKKLNEQEDMKRRIGMNQVRGGLDQTRIDLPSWVRSYLPPGEKVKAEDAMNNIEEFMAIAKETNVFGSVDWSNPGAEAEARKRMEQAILAASTPAGPSFMPGMMLPAIPRQQFEQELAAKKEGRNEQSFMNKLANEKPADVLRKQLDALKKQHNVNQSEAAKRLAEKLQAQRKSR